MGSPVPDGFHDGIHAQWPPVALVGGYWERYPAFRAQALGIKPPEIIRALTASAKVNFCLVRRANRDGHVMRSFEIAATGGCMVAEDTVKHREIFGRKARRPFTFAMQKKPPSVLERFFAVRPNAGASPQAYIVASSMVLIRMRIGLERCLRSRAADDGT